MLPSCLDSTIEPLELNVADLLEFRSKEGLIYMHDQRVLIQSADSMGILRRYLIRTFGLAEARKTLLRYGYVNGYRDSLTFSETMGAVDPVERWRKGPPHSRKGDSGQRGDALGGLLGSLLRGRSAPPFSRAKRRRCVLG
jgi:hypothetical protein